MKEPIDIATADTVGFLTQHLEREARVIEVGCGAGHVAQALQGRGYRVVGLDADSETVASANERGAHVVLATWPEFDSEPVDAITFTRSLHHIEDLPRALQKARDTLRPHGKLLIEDFAFDVVDQRTITWLVNVVRGQTLVNIGASDFLTHLIAAEDPAVFWRRHHEEHGVHSIEAIHRSIAERFIINDTAPAAYLYRYLIPALPATTNAAVFLQQVVRDELQRGHAGQIELIGRRIVALPIAE